MAEETETNAAVDQGKVSDALEKLVINPPLSLVFTLALETVANKSERNDRKVVMAPVRTRYQKNLEESDLPIESTNPGNARSEPQRSELTSKDYPAPSAFEDMGLMRALSFYWDAAWVQRDAVEDTELIRCYNDRYRWLPGNFLLVVTQRAVWRDQFRYYDTCI